MYFIDSNDLHVVYVSRNGKDIVFFIFKILIFNIDVRDIVLGVLAFKNNCSGREYIILYDTKSYIMVFFTLVFKIKLN